MGKAFAKSIAKRLETQDAWNTLFQSVHPPYHIQNWSFLFVSFWILLRITWHTKDKKIAASFALWPQTRSVSKHVFTLFLWKNAWKCCVFGVFLLSFLFKRSTIWFSVASPTFIHLQRWFLLENEWEMDLQCNAIFVVHKACFCCKWQENTVFSCFLDAL